MHAHTHTHTHTHTKKKEREKRRKQKEVCEAIVRDHIMQRTRYCCLTCAIGTKQKQNLFSY